MMIQWDHFINGAIRAPSSGAYINSFDPCTGRVAAVVAAGTQPDVDDAVRSAATLPIFINTA